MKNNLLRLEVRDIPRDLNFEEEGDILKLTMNQIGINGNMQEDAAAFEAWALLAKAHGYIQVQLYKEKDICITNERHYNRFLYRAYCFNELFDWFILSEDLIQETQKFRKKYLDDKVLVYNVPDNEGENNPQKDEAIMENYFVTHTEETNMLLGLNSTKYYSQLPVGTFYKTKSENSYVFTGKKSAIDFWGITDNVLNIVELKVKGNKKLGVLSELFFYVCLMRDFHINKIAKAYNQTELRGFDKIRNTDIKEINGIILTEQIHPGLKFAYEELKKANEKDAKIKFANNIIQYDSANYIGKILTEKWNTIHN